MVGKKTDERRSTFFTKLGEAERAKVGCCPSLHQAIHSKLNNKTICGYGEIGRRFRLRFLWVKHIVRVQVPLSAP